MVNIDEIDLTPLAFAANCLRAALESGDNDRIVIALADYLDAHDSLGLGDIYHGTDQRGRARAKAVQNLKAAVVALLAAAPEVPLGAAVAVRQAALVLGENAKPVRAVT
jgi:hypothetical protein